MPRPSCSLHDALAEVLRVLVDREAGTSARDLHDVPIGVAQVDRPEVGAVEHLGAPDPARLQVLAPALDLLGRVDGEREVVRAAAPDLRLFHLRVLHAGDHRPGRAGRVAEEEVERVRVVGIAGALDHPQAERVAVEGDGALEVRADQRDVVDALYAEPARLLGARAHARKPRPPERRLNTWRSGQKAAANTTTPTGRKAIRPVVLPRRKNASIPAATPAAPASSVVCDLKPAKCSRMESSRPASEPSTSAQMTITPPRSPRTMRPATNSTMAPSTTSSTSGKPPHGAGGRSSGEALPRRRGAGRRSPDAARAAARRSRAASRSARVVVGALDWPAEPARSPRLRLRLPMDVSLPQAGGGLSPPANGQPEEIFTRHQPISIPMTPRRGRTCQFLQPGSPMSSLRTRSHLWLAGSSSISSMRARNISSR